jgi:hypothetical protein
MSGSDIHPRRLAEGVHPGGDELRHAAEAMRGGRVCKRYDEETRQRMSEAHRTRGTLVPGTRPWSAAEDEAIWTLPPKAIDAVRRDRERHSLR